MKSILFMAMIVLGLAACETPQPATGTSEDNMQSQPSGTSGAGTTGKAMDSTKSTTDTSTMKKDSLR